MLERMGWLKPYWVGAWNLAQALVLAYAFIIVLMTASSQAGVAARLERLSPPLDYSAAYPQWLERQKIERDIAVQQSGIKEVNAKLEAAVRAEQAASDASWTTLAPLLALHPKLSTIEECDFDPTRTAPGDVARTLSKISYCLADANLSESIRRDASRVVGTSKPILANSEKWLDMAHNVNALKRQRADLQNGLRWLQTRRTELNAINDSFGEISVLQRSWMVGGGALIEFPPSMTQILLAFVSGLFGSLLLTLVLIVYPKSDIKLSETGKGYGARILLGGLISLCVFVVIGGGTAVLGTDNAFAGGEANYLAFCAIGILAGMFSDRVASWLSERADAFFKVSAQQAAAKAEVAADRAAAQAQVAVAAEKRDAAEQAEPLKPNAPPAAEAGAGI